MRLMVLKQRYRWGYRTLVAEVSDSIHLRRFCRISLTERVPDESTVRKLTRRIGPETVSELTRALIVKATREKRFRPRAVRIDSTVIEADVKYPTDAGLASAGVRVLAREGRKLAALIREKGRRVRDRSRSMGRKLRAICAHDPPAFGGGEGRGADADQADRRAVGALGQGGAPARGRRQAQGARAWREGEAHGRRGRWRSSRIAARRSPVRSASASRASRSTTGSCRWPIRTPGRSARASSASRTSSGTSRS